jgi:outer membrane protein TolC
MKTHTRIAQIATSLALPLLAAAVLSGCSFAPRYTPPPVETPAAFKELTLVQSTNLPGWKLAEPRDGFPRGKWWEVFNDPVLNSLEEQCTASNLNIQASFQAFLAARALVVQAR